jgi:hypothetical protein
MKLHTPVILATTAALALGATACGEDAQEDSAAAPSSQAQTMPEPVAKIDRLSGRSTAVKLDDGFVGALESLEVTPGAVGDARITKGGSAVFPITGGNVTYFTPGTVSPYVQGSIDHTDSGLSLKAGGKTVELTDFVVDPGRSVLTGTVTVDGEPAAQDAPLFFLDGRTLKPLDARDNGTAVLEGTTVKLKAEAADLLNTTFGIDALQEGLVIGVATITVDVPAA